ncbi:MAG: methionyl-tRNA formyltransferase, partial [Thiohalomonadales bacterium]
VAVYSQPDRPAGRGRKPRIGAVKQVAVEAGLPIYQPESLKDPEQQQQLSELAPDLMVVVAYGLLLPPSILDIPRLGCINIHASLLPNWRGAAPIQRAIIAGDRRTGVTIMQMEQGLDTGPILRKAEIDIEPGDTSQALHDRLARLGGSALLETLQDIHQGCLSATTQDEAEATYAQKLTKDEAAIDWRKPAQILERQVLGFNPWPVAHCQLDATTLRIWQAKAVTLRTEATPGTVLSQSAAGIAVATGEGVLSLIEVQLPGKSAMRVRDFNNARNIVGKVLT